MAFMKEESKIAGDTSAIGFFFMGNVEIYWGVEVLKLEVWMFFFPETKSVTFA